MQILTKKILMSRFLNICFKKYQSIVLFLEEVYSAVFLNRENIIHCLKALRYFHSFEFTHKYITFSLKLFTVAILCLSPFHHTSIYLSSFLFVKRSLQPSVRTLKRLITFNMFSAVFILT